MGSKLIVLLALSVATVLVISSEVAASEVAETSHTIDPSMEAEEVNAAVNEAKYGGRYYGDGHHGGGRGCRYGCPGGGGGRCSHRCCRRGPHGCRRCCSYAGEKPDADYEAEPQN